MRLVYKKQTERKVRKITVECKAIDMCRSANGASAVDTRIKRIPRFQLKKLLIHDATHLNCNFNGTKTHFASLLRNLKEKMLDVDTTPSLIPEEERECSGRDGIF